MQLESITKSGADSNLGLMNEEGKMVSGGDRIKGDKTTNPPKTVADTRDSKIQSISPLAPISVQAAHHYAGFSSSQPALAPQSKIFDKFSLAVHVSVLSGGNHGLGFKMVLALCKAGMKAVYCIDLLKVPSDSWEATHGFVEVMVMGHSSNMSVPVCTISKICGENKGHMDVIFLGKYSL